MADISKLQVPIDGVMTEFNIKGSGGGYTPIVLPGTLEAGETEITFTDSNILEDSMIDIFIDSDEDLYPTSKTSTVGEVVLEFEAQSSDLNIALLIFNLMR